MNIKEQTTREEFVRNLNHNYLRVRLQEKPEEKKFQYCILQRGGIGHLLPCDLRYINEEAFLYYEITSLQNLCQIFQNRKVDRKWFGDFLWGMQKVQGELNRFLLEKEHLVWGPEHVFQDYEKNDFYFQFIPYENHEDTFRNMLDFMIEKLDYKDESFVEFFYGIYEKYDQIGTDFIIEKLYEEYERFLEAEKSGKQNNSFLRDEESEKREDHSETGRYPQRNPQTLQNEAREYMQPSKAERKKVGFFGLFRRKMKQKTEGESGLDSEENLFKERMRNQFYREDSVAMVSESDMSYGHVEHDTNYRDVKTTDYIDENVSNYVGDTDEAEYGKTVYIENDELQQDRGLYKENGELLVRLTEFPFVLGKKRDEVQYAFTHPSISRIHARFLFENGEYFLEDINSTNGSYKNGLRLRPYEKKKLEKEDEIRFGSLVFTFR